MSKVEVKRLNMEQARINSGIRIEAPAGVRVSFASLQNGVPVLGEVVIINEGDEPLQDVELTIASAPVFFRAAALRISRISAHQRYRVSSLDLQIDPGTLARLNEAEKGSIHIELRKDHVELAGLDIPVELLARNQWGGIVSFPELAAAFVQPNDPAVARLLGKTVAVLRSHGKEPSIVGYQRGKKGVWEQLTALWNAVCTQRIGYVLPPASFEQTGQKVRQPSEIIESGIGTCLDLTMLFASCMEQCGLNPLLIFTRGHAFCGCWLSHETFSTAVMDDVTALRKRLHLQELLLLETTLAVQHKEGAPSFKLACERGEALLAGDQDESFQLAVDVRRARMQRIRPLALAEGLVQPQSPEEPATEALEPEFDEAPDFVIDTTTPDFILPKGPITRLDRWQRRLLDLSLRNSLIHFRASKRVVELLVPNPAALEEKLVSGRRLRVLPGVEEQDGDPRSQAIHEERQRDDLLRSRAIEALDRGQLLAPMPKQELDGRLLELYRSARNSLEEGGANTLFLALGFLSWRPVERSRMCKAPLVLVPVKLERKSVHLGFSLSLHDDEPRFNLTLLEMLRKDFQISDLDVFEKDLPKDGDAVDIDRVWREVQKAIRDIPGWEVLPVVSLGLFSFAKYLMWKDLVEHTEVLKGNPVVRHLLETPSEKYGNGGGFFDPRELDRKLPAREVYCPLPVDSSQLSAVVSAAQGRDFVLIGPPGTGKSQTISNMIAQCLAEGKTVLFVAEKTAALNVVYRRLRDIGLGDLCLELHSHKARKLDVLAQLRRAHEASASFSEARWEFESNRLTELRGKLNEYVETLHRPYPNGLTPFLAMGGMVDRGDVPVVKLDWGSPDRHDQAALARLRDLVARVGLHAPTALDLETSPLKWVRHWEWSPRWASELTEAAHELAGACGRLQEAAAVLLQVTGIPPMPMDEKGREGLGGLAGVLPKAAGRDWRFVLRPDAPLVVQRLREGVALRKEYGEHAARLSVPYRSEALTLDHDVLLSIWKLASSPWLLRLKEAVDLLTEYGRLARTLSVPYGADVYNLDLTSLHVTWEQSKGKWWLRRSALQGMIRKVLLRVSISKEKARLDCEGDLSALIAMREAQDRLSRLKPLGKEARSLWVGDPALPAAKCAAFRDALRQAVAHVVDVENAPVSLDGVLKHLFKADITMSGRSVGPEDFRFGQGDPAFFLRNGVVAVLQGVSEAGGSVQPDGAEDLAQLGAMRVLMDRISSFDDLREKTAGCWSGGTSRVEDIEQAVAFYEALQAAVMRYVDRPETLVELHAALELLLGPGNVLLAEQGGVGGAISGYLAALEELHAKRNTLSTLADSEGIEWLGGDLVSIIDVCDRIVALEPSIHAWCAWLRVRNEAAGEGLSALVDAMVTGLVNPGGIAEAFEVNYCRWWLMAAVDDLPVLRSFVALEHEREIRDFRFLDKELREMARQCIRMRLRSGGNGEEDREARKEWGILKREMEKKMRHLPLRRLIASIPTLLTKLTPCLLMSPLSIAQYLTPGMKLFDLIVFDEASQIPVWDAIGTMARGKRVVVVGDPKQLPPTNFFTRSDDEQADDEVAQEADMESILDECLGASLPTLQLRWHYRSRHESLITFSNHRYYEGGLVTFPSPYAEDRAVSSIYVGGTYQRGVTRTNPDEAKAVVSDIVSRLERDAAGNGDVQSIGVVTFNSEQQRLIEDLLDAERRKNRALDRFFDDEMPEPVFVKNLENVQGDERDIVYFSTTYGPDQAGRVSMNFGPLNKDGGERRLNVAVTRARSELRVFTSLLPDQIDITRTNAAGVKDLKLFLDFARYGPRAFLTGDRGDQGEGASLLERAVAAALAQRGWTVHAQVGVSTFRVDLAVLDPDVPGRYLAGIECDGSTYRSAATARDRDKLREQVLRRLGWEILRVWSTELWTSPEWALNRLHDRLTKILETVRKQRAEEAANGKERDGAFQEAAGETEYGYVEEHRPAFRVDSPSDVSTAGHASLEYCNGEGRPEDRMPDESDEQVDEKRMMEAIEEVIKKESPVHQNTLAPYVIRSMGLQKTGKRFWELVWTLARRHFPSTREDVGEFFWGLDSPPGQCATCRPGSEGKPRHIDRIAMPELIALARSVSPKTGEDPIVLMARFLGYQRIRQSLRLRLEDAWAQAASLKD